MANFVDGEYAEAYYEYIEAIISKNKKCFCRTYLKLNENSKIRLEENYYQNCKTKNKD